MHTLFFSFFPLFLFNLIFFLNFLLLCFFRVPGCSGMFHVPAFIDSQGDKGGPGINRLYGINKLTDDGDYDIQSKKRPSIKPGTWNFPEHSGTFRNIPEHSGTFRNIPEQGKKIKIQKNNNNNKLNKNKGKNEKKSVYIYIK